MDILTKMMLTEVIIFLVCVLIIKIIGHDSMELLDAVITVIAEISIVAFVLCAVIKIWMM